MIKYILILTFIEGGIWLPQLYREYDDYNKCMSEAIQIQLDKNNPYNAVCMPAIEEKPKTST
jgi:hypothetical protein